MNLSKDYNKATLVNLSNINLAFDLQKINSSSIRDSFVSLIRAPLRNILSQNDMFHCLKNISLTINEGDRVGIIGKNGAGKTSLCHVIAGNFIPTTGNVTRLCKTRSVFSANPQIFPELSGKENAQVVARLLYPNFNDRELKDIVNESIAFSDLEDFNDVAIKNYSKGMSARLFLSLVTARPTELLILDEVFDGADIFFKDKFSSRLEGIISQSKATIFINHDSKMLQQHVNRAIVMNKGEIVFDGNPTKGFFIYQNLGLR